MLQELASARVPLLDGSDEEESATLPKDDDGTESDDSAIASRILKPGQSTLLDAGMDILNRVTGPTDSGASSFELLENVKPKILPIQPLGT